MFIYKQQYVLPRISTKEGMLFTLICNVTFAVMLLGFSNLSLAAPFAYVTHDGSSNNSDAVSVIDMASNTVTATVNVGRGPRGIAINPSGTKVYVSSFYEDTVSVIDTASTIVIATVNVGAQPKDIAISPDGTKAYVSSAASGKVYVIDTASDTVIDAVVIGGSPSGIVFNPSGTRAYVGNNGSYDYVSVIDTAKNMKIDELPLGFVSMAINPAGTKIYGGSKFSDVEVYDIASGHVTASVPVGKWMDGFNDIAINSAGTKVYTANHGTPSFSVIDTASNTETARVNIGRGPMGIALNTEGTKAYIVTWGITGVDPDRVFVIDTASNTIVAKVNVGAYPWKIAIAHEKALPPSPPSTPYPSYPGLGINGSSLTIQLTAGDNIGRNADWWVVAHTPWGHWFSYVYPNRWVDIGTDLSTVSPAYQGPLSDISGLEISNIAGIPSGNYDLYFGVDTNMNGVLDYDQLYYFSLPFNAP